MHKKQITMAQTLWPMEKDINLSCGHLNVQYGTTQKTAVSKTAKTFNQLVIQIFKSKS